MGVLQRLAGQQLEHYEAGSLGRVSSEAGHALFQKGEHEEMAAEVHGRGSAAPRRLCRVFGGSGSQ